MTLQTVLAPVDERLMATAIKLDPEAITAAEAA
jgi:hypothetical protein